MRRDSKHGPINFAARCETLAVAQMEIEQFFARKRTVFACGEGAREGEQVIKRMQESGNKSESSRQVGIRRQSR